MTQLMSAFTYVQKSWKSFDKNSADKIHSLIFSSRVFSTHGHIKIETILIPSTDMEILPGNI